jgi:hypothetical protein
VIIYIYICVCVCVHIHTYMYFGHVAPNILDRKNKTFKKGSVPKTILYYIISEKRLLYKFFNVEYFEQPSDNC